jgi:Ca2+-binding RTX toxin-like protein
MSVSVENIQQLEDGISAALTRVEQLLVADGFAADIPILGTQLLDTYNSAVSDVRDALTTIGQVRDALVGAFNAVQAVSNLSSMSSEQARSLIQQKIDEFMDAAGLNDSGFPVPTVTVNDAGDIGITVGAARSDSFSFNAGDLGMNSLNLTLDGTATAATYASASISFGLDGSGFYLSKAGTSFNLGANVSLGDFSVDADFGYLTFEATNLQEGTVNNNPGTLGAADTLSLNLSGSLVDADGKIRLSELSTDILNVGAKGDLDLDVQLGASGGDTAAPSIEAILRGDYHFEAGLQNGQFTGDPGDLTLSFDQVRYDLGDFIENFVRPVVEKMAAVIVPLNQVLGALNLSLSPILPDDWEGAMDVAGGENGGADGEVTLIDLLELADRIDNVDDFNPGPLAQLINVVTQVTNFINAVTADIFNPGFNFDVGSYQVVLDEVNSVSEALGNIDVEGNDFVAAGTDILELLQGLSAGSTSGGTLWTDVLAGRTATAAVEDLIDSSIFNIPIIEDPINAIRLLMGQTVDLITVDVAPIEIGLGDFDANGNPTDFITLASTPIWPLPLITLDIKVAFQAVIDLAFGFDSSGLQQWADTGFNQAQTGLILNGLYLSDLDSEGVDIDEIILRAGIEIGGSIEAIIGRLSGGGNITGELFLDLDEGLADGDGKIYIGSILANPFSLFEIDGGRITAGFRAALELGIPPFRGTVWEFASPRLTLLDISDEAGAVEDPISPQLGHMEGAELHLNIGGDAGLRDQNQDGTSDARADGREVVEVSGLAGGVRLGGFGLSERFLQGTVGTVSLIVGDGGAGNDEILLDADVTVAADLSGGDGNDTLQAGKGDDTLDGDGGDDWILGDEGVDTIGGGDGNDYLEGGKGADAINGGAGDFDVATYYNAGAGVTLDLANGALNAGDAAGDSFAGIEAYQGSNHADIIRGSAGRDLLYGAGGNDQLFGRGGNDFLVGNEGANLLNGGAGGLDVVGYYFASSGITVAATGLNATVQQSLGGVVKIDDTLADIEAIRGSRHADQMTGGAGEQNFYGDEGNDSLSGGAGNDFLVGGAGADALTGGEGIDRARYTEAAAGVTLNLTAVGAGGEAQGDTFSGIEDVEGSAHNDLIVGDGEANYLLGLGGIDNLQGSGGNDILEGSAGGDALNGGDGRDEATYYNSASGVIVNRRSGVHTGDAQGDTFSGIEVISGSRFADTIRGSDEAAVESVRTLVVTSDNAGASGSAAPDNDFGVMSNWQAANPVEFILNTADLGVATVAKLTIDATDVDPAVAEWGGVSEQNEVLLNGIPIGFLNSASTRDAGQSSTTFAFDASLLRADGKNLVTIRNVNSTHPGEWHFSIDKATLVLEAGSLEELRGYEGNDTLLGGGGGDLLIGGADNDDLRGEEDDDTLRGDAGADKLSGGTGEDLFIGGTGDDLIDGGVDRDRVTYLTSAAAVVVNLAAEERNIGGVVQAARSAQDGSGATDSFVAGPDSRSAVEDVTGSLFADRIHGSENGSRLEGLDGADRLVGFTGDDELNGGKGADILTGGGGSSDWAVYSDDDAGVNVSIEAGSGVDGSGATDTLSQIENLRGSRHNDILAGAAGANRIDGGEGDDRLDGKTGADVLRGGTGDDIYFVDQVGNANPATDDNVFDSGGHDLIRSSVDYTIPLEATVEDLLLEGSVAIGFGNNFGNRLIGNNAVNILDGLGGGDTFWGYGGSDIYYFDSLGDSIGVGAAPRGVLGGSGEAAGGGTDEIRLRTTGLTAANTAIAYSIDVAWAQQIENVILQDNDRNISLIGNARNNRLVGNAHWQTLSGGAGNDVLDAKTGRDTIDGGADFDTLVIDWSHITYGIATGNVGGTLGDGYRRDFYWSGNYNDGGFNLAVGLNIERFDIKTGSGADHLITGDADDIIHGGGGNDWLNSAKGVDQVDGGLGSEDRWEADKSFALATADGSQDIEVNLTRALQSAYLGGGTLRGIEALTLATGGGDDSIVTLGSFLHDQLWTNGGSDEVTVAGGRDYVDMGAGNDTLVIDWSGINYGISTGNVQGTLAGGYRRDFYWTGNYNDGGFNLAIGVGVEHFNIKTGSGADNLVTGDGDDRIHSGAGHDFIRTGEGADIIAGGEQADLTRGVDAWAADKSKATEAMAIDLTVNGASSYVIDGRTGSVRGVEQLGYHESGVRHAFISGKGGDDIRTMDAFYHDQIDTVEGNDRVLVQGGRDHIRMGAGVDTLVVNWSQITYGIATGNIGGTFADGYRRDFYWSGNYNDGGFNLVIGEGVEHFDVTTGSGADKVVSGDGDDRLIGNGGDDHLVSGTGTDIIDGGSGNDRWEADKSEAGETQHLIVDLTAASTQSSYFGAGSVSGIEMLTLITGAGDEKITTTGGFFNDQVTANDGDDWVKVAGGRDHIQFGAGEDKLVVDWSGINYGIATGNVTGTLAGGYRRDFYWSGNYNDGAFNLAIAEGVEHFDITTGSGADHLITGDGDDRLVGNGGNDHLVSGTGTDIIDGGTGNDRWEADKSEASATQRLIVDLTAASTQSSYFGTGSITGIEMLSLITGAGADAITTTGGFFADQVITNGGDDVVKVGGGRDYVDTGAGFDTLVVDWSDIDDDIYTTSVAGTLADGYRRDFYWRGNYNDGAFNQVVGQGVERFDIRTGSGGDYLITGDGNDRVDSGAGHDWINSGMGADVVIGGNQADGTRGVDAWAADKSNATKGMLINLTANGASTYQIGAVVGSVSGMEALGFYDGALHRFTSGSGADDIRTMNAFYHDYVDTGAGNDRFLAQGGRDQVIMGAGTDTLVINWSDIDYSIATTSFSGSLAGGYHADFYWSGNYNDGAFDHMIADGVEHFDITTGTAADSIRTGDGNDSLNGGGGDDTLSSGAGADQINGGTGNDRWEADKSAALAGQAINVDLTKAVQSTYLNSGTVRGIEMLSLTTGLGKDQIVTLGAFHNDAVSTGGGDDRVTVAGGRDLIEMGAGTDTLVVDWSGITYGIATANIGGNLADGHRRDFYWGGNYNDGAFNLVIGTGVEHFDIKTGSGNDHIVTGDGNDVVRGGAGADTLHAGGGVDTVRYDDKTAGIAVVLDGANQVTVSIGGAAEDAIAGFENVLGGSGGDSLTGDASANILTGNGGDDTIEGAGGNDRLDGGVGTDLLSYAGATGAVKVNLALLTAQNTSGAGVDTLTGFEWLQGSAFNDTLAGTAAANKLIGGLGADSMTGGAGNDLYVADRTTDKAIETAAAHGTDTVESSASFTLGAYVEKLVLTGSAGIAGTGNGLANTITGNEGANRIDGKANADAMAGGAGNDTYLVDDAGDKVTEAANSGVDAVQSKVSFVLGANIEKLTLAGSAGIAGTGNGLANTITGNSEANALDGGGGNDRLDGKAGADKMTGGAGNDVFVADNAGDVVVEALGGGTDSVQSSVSFTLANHVENLTLTGTAAAGTGNALANSITGNAAANTLNGAGGIDRLTGGGGADSFLFDSLLNATTNVDEILDFSAAADTIALDRTVFAGVGALGTLSAAAFQTGTAALDANDRIIYDSATGRIFYDADGSGNGAAILFAVVDPKTALTNADFNIVA